MPLKNTTSLGQPIWRIAICVLLLVPGVFGMQRAQAQPLMDASPWVGDASIGTGLQMGASAPAVRQPNNEYRESHVDLQVSAPGGPIRIVRSWSQGRWWLNPAWGPLSFELDPLDATPAVIERAGLLYERSGSATLFISRANSYAPVYIRKTAANPYSGQTPGWQWYDRLGNTIDYDVHGRILGYANPGGVQVRFAYDSPTQIRILDHHAVAAYTLTLSDGLVTRVQDRAARSVTYHWSGAGDSRRLSQVTDAAGQTWHYQYDANGQITQRTDPLGAQGQTITVQYANSVAAPAAQLRVGSAGQTYDPSGTSGPARQLKSIWGAARVARLSDGRTSQSASTQYLREKRQFLVNQSDARGNSIETRYDLAGLPLQRRFNGKTTYARRWDGDYHSISTDARGLATRHDYDHNRQITQTVHPDGSRESSQYNDKGLKTRHTNEAGVQTLWEYDSAGRITKQIEAAGTPGQRETAWQYDPYGQAVQRSISAAGADALLTTWQYDNLGNRIRQTDALGQVTTWTYDLAGNPTSRTDALGRTSTWRYNARGQIIQATSPMGHTTTIEYDARGQRVKTTDPLGHSTTSAYDPYGQLQSRTDALGHTSTYEYNAYGDLIKTTSAEGVETSNTHDEQGRPQSQTDAHGNTTTYTWGAHETGSADLLLAITYPGALQHRYQYDPRGRQTVSSQKAQDGQELRSTSTYDAAGRLVAATSPGGKTTRSAYDNLDRILESIDADGHATHYAWNIHDQIAQVTDANGNVHRFDYDKLGRLVQESRPEGGKTRYAYDGAGQLVQRTNPDGDVVQYRYDRDGRKIEETRSSHTGKADLGQVTTYSHDAAGQLTGYAQKDGSGQAISSARYTRDSLGRSAREAITYGQGAQAVTATIAQTWNADGQKTGQTWPDGQTARFTYDRGLLKTATQPGSAEQITWAAYHWSLPKTIEYPGSQTSIQYDGFWRYQRLQAQSGGGQNILSLAWQYDLEGNITQIDRAAAAGIEGTTRYGYDNLNRLTSAQPGQSLQEMGLPREQYHYDAVHNRTHSAHQSGAWKYASGNRLSQWGYEQNQVHYGYSASGHITRETRQGKTRTYQYDGGERLVEIQDDGQTLARYRYDPFNRRISKTTTEAGKQQTTYFVYCDEGLLAELDQQGRQGRTYGWEPDSPWGTKPLWQGEHTHTPRSSTYHYLHTDHLGTPRAAADKAGTISWQGLGEAFGTMHVLAASRITMNLRFPGQYFDQETRTHYNFHRDYDPNTGRYVQSDPIGLDGGINYYGYAESNPARSVDPKGLQSSVQWCYQSPANAETCNEAGMLPKPIRIPPPIVFPENCDDACEKAIVEASNRYWKLITKRMPQYQTGGTRGRDPNHARSILKLQRALKKAITKVRLHCGDNAVRPEWEEAANAPLPK